MVTVQGLREHSFLWFIELLRQSSNNLIKLCYVISIINKSNMLFAVQHLIFIEPTKPYVAVCRTESKKKKFPKQKKCQKIIHVPHQLKRAKSAKWFLYFLLWILQLQKLRIRFGQNNSKQKMSPGCLDSKSNWNTGATMHVHLAIWLFIHFLDAFFFAATPLTSCLFGCYCDELFAQKSPPSSALATLTTHCIPLGCKKCKK